ncbi:MAG: S4 domain-containing protein [Bacilli bacterium]|nr:S4 domain-containing protein [Bacilli bacterium]
MRLDKFLKLTRIIKRRTVAKDISAAGKVIIDKKTVKPSYLVKVGDVLELYLADFIVIVKVLSVDEKVIRGNPENSYTIIGKQLNAN